MSNPSHELLDRLATAERAGFQPTLMIPLLRLLAHGDPVAVEDLATSTGRGVEELRTSLAAHPDTEYDDEGRIIGQGLTLRPTAHRFTVDGQELYAWCAMDTLMFPALIDRTASIESTSPTSGRPIRLTAGPGRVTEVEPATAVVSLVYPEDPTSIRSSVCNQIHFFASAEDAEPWLADHPDAELLPVAEAHELGVELTTSWLDGLEPGTQEGTSDTTGGGCCS